MVCMWQSLATVPSCLGISGPRCFVTRTQCLIPTLILHSVTNSLAIISHTNCSHPNAIMGACCTALRIVIASIPWAIFTPTPLGPLISCRLCMNCACKFPTPPNNGGCKAEPLNPAVSMSPICMGSLDVVVPSPDSMFIPGNPICGLMSGGKSNPIGGSSIEDMPIDDGIVPIIGTLDSAPIGGADVIIAGCS